MGILELSSAYIRAVSMATNPEIRKLRKSDGPAY